MSLPTVRRLAALVMIAALAIACGKKGPPLAPFARVPQRVDNVVPARIGEQVFLSFTVPTANIDGRKPADLASLEVFAVTATRTPDTREERAVATRLGALDVRPILPAPPPPKPGEPALPPLSLAPGLDQGATAVFAETLTAALEVPQELPRKKPIPLPVPTVEPDEPYVGPLVAPIDAAPLRRYYFVKSFSPRGREGPPSAVVSVPFGDTSLPPGAPRIDYTESTMTLEWAPSPNARSWTIAPVVPPPPPPKPATPADEPAAASPPVPAPVLAPAPLLPIAVKSLGFSTQATLYHVYELPSLTRSNDAPLQVPKPFTPQPLDATKLELKTVSFGKERCFFVRPVDTLAGMSVQGPASPTTCVTPKDTFPPSAPKSLAAIASAGSINLIWDPNSEPDLAGYLVLRAEAPGDRLLPLTPSPIRETTYRDTAVQPGLRYVYAVVAVDNATSPNQSPPSNRIEETARQ